MQIIQYNSLVKEQKKVKMQPGLDYTKKCKVLSTVFPNMTILGI